VVLQTCTPRVIATIGACLPSHTRFGGIFLRANDPESLYKWYQQHLGLKNSEGAYTFAPPSGFDGVIFTLFKPGDTYFPPAQPAMINLQVEDLDALLDRLAADGVAVDPNREVYDFGKFGWVTDPEGNRIELWQPASSGTA
jgi:predicted enzyme related to lactoylglutathione lyase